MKLSDGQDWRTWTAHTTESIRPFAAGTGQESRGTPMHDPVRKPPHYCYGEVEVIDFIEQVVAYYPPEIGYHIGNVLKYLSRAPHKGKLSEDLMKAGFYLKRATDKGCALKPKVQMD